MDDGQGMDEQQNDEQPLAADEGQQEAATA